MNNENFEIVMRKVDNIDVIISQIGINLIDLNKRLHKLERIQELKGDH